MKFHIILNVGAGGYRRGLCAFTSVCLAMLFVYSGGKVYGQENKISDSLKVEQLVQRIADSPVMSPQRMIAIGDEAVDFSEKKNYKEGIVRGLIAMSMGYGRQGDTKKAMESLTRSIEISRENKLYKREGRALLGLGQMYERLGMNDKAFECYTNALAVYNTLKDSSKIALSYSFIGYSLNGMRKYEDAVKYFFRSLELNKILGEKGDIQISLSDIGSAYLELKRFPEAWRYMQDAVQMAYAGNDTLANIFINVGAYYQVTGNFDSAIFFYQKSLKRAFILNDKEDEGKIYSNIGLLYLKQRKLKEAEYYAKKGLAIADSIMSNELVLAAAGNLAEINAYKHDYGKAYEYQVRAYAANDSLMNRDKEKALAEMQVRFEVEEVDNKNKLLQKENDIKQIRLQRKNILIYSGFGVAMLISVIGFQVVRHNKLHANKKLMEVEQKQLLAQMNPHFIFNCLNSIQQYVVQNDAENANKYLADFALLMRQTLDNSKDGVIPLQREIDYLENYLSLESMRFENKFSYTIDCADGINKNTLEIPSMIIQPFVENAIHHGLRNLEHQDGRLSIRFYKNAEHLYCEVDDNGIGMEESKRLKEQRFIQYQSHGMELTRQRLELVSKMHSTEYEITVVDKKNGRQEANGTTIIIKFPMRT